MKKQNKISIWIGNFDSEDDFYEFIEEKYDEDGKSSSAFREEFKTGYIDHDFQESFFVDEELTKEDFMETSYGESFVDKLDDALLTGNGVIMLYDFEYSGEIKAKNNVNFIGAYDYIK